MWTLSGTAYAVTIRGRAAPPPRLSVPPGQRKTQMRGQGLVDGDRTPEVRLGGATLPIRSMAPRTWKSSCLRRRSRVRSTSICPMAPSLASISPPTRILPPLRCRRRSVETAGRRRRIRRARCGRLRHLTTGRVLVKVAETRAPAPAHLDVIAGAARPSHTLDRGGPLDRCVRACCTAMRVRARVPRRRNFGRPGDQGTGFADDERDIGLDRVYALELSEPKAARDLSHALNDLAGVEWAMPEPLTVAPWMRSRLRTRARWYCGS